jgi:alginate O-acetyltransferase complex protein AlgI
MLFHTWEFFVFFAIVYAGYLCLRKTPYYLHWLLVASYVFYGWWNVLFLFLIAYSTTLDYCAVILMDRRGRKKRWLAMSVVNNLFLLGFFKYAGFITANFNALLELLNVPLAAPEPDITLPVGISFFIFQSMSYTIDFYRGDIEREPSFFRFAAFVSLFPQLVAGPIERARNLLPQLTGTPTIRKQDITDGMSLFVVGLFKKVALADYLSLYVDKIYEVPDMHDGLTLLVATFAFSWQIYFDFSGYTDMARGIARMMGFNFMLNFNNPYLATSLGDFWARWHISLSTWFRDYLYIPLGGNRRGTFAMYRNIFITMVISGFWHGAAWTFVTWGALHAVGRMLTRELERTPFYRDRVPKLAKQLLVFAFVTFAWIYFRAHNISDANLIVRKIFSGVVSDPRAPVVMLLMCMSVWVYQFIYESRARKVLSWAPVRIGVTVAMILCIIAFSGGSESPFIYFQF